MTQATAEASGLVRVSVVAGSRRVDLALPGSVPVAELLPELTRSVGVLDSATVHGGYTLVASDGRRLSSDTGLTFQGIEDGGVLTVASGVDERPPRLYDDVVEAMADVVESDLRPWEPASGRRTSLVAACLFLGLGAFALLLQRPSVLAGAAAAIAAVLLVAASFVLCRVQREEEVGVALAWMAVLYAVVAGLVITPAGPLFGAPVAAAGGGALLIGILSLVGLREHRALVLPAIVVGSIFAVCGSVLLSTDFEPAAVLSIALTLAVILGSMVPWFALGSTGTRVEQAHSHADLTAEPAPIDPERVRADMRLGHGILLAVSATVGLLVVLVAPLAVGLGLSGTLLVVAACVIVMLRTRQYRTGSEVLVGLLSGIVGLLAVALSAVLLHPEWRPAVAVVLAVVGAVVLALTLVPGPPSIRRGRLGDVAEVVALVAMLPLLVLAVGIIGGVRG